MARAVLLSSTVPNLPAPLTSDVLGLAQAEPCQAVVPRALERGACGSGSQFENL